jgi:hypothetical protein
VTVAAWSNFDPLADSRLAFVAAEASILVDGVPVVRRELLHIDEVARRFVVQSPRSSALVRVDFRPCGIEAALVGPDRVNLEVDLLVGGMRAVAIDAWAMCVRDAADACLIDAFGRAVIPDLCARDASMTPMVVAPGRYLLQVSTEAGPCVVRFGPNAVGSLAQPA